MDAFELPSGPEILINVIDLSNPDDQLNLSDGKEQVLTKFLDKGWVEEYADNQLIDRQEFPDEKAQELFDRNTYNNKAQVLWEIGNRYRQPVRNTLS